MNFFAASSLSPSTDFGMYIAAVPGQTVMPFLAASVSGEGEESDIVRLTRSDVLDVVCLAAELRIVRSGSGGDRLDPVVQLGRGEILIEVAGVFDVLDVLEPGQGGRRGRVLSSPAV